MKKTYYEMLVNALGYDPDDESIETNQDSEMILMPAQYPKGKPVKKKPEQDYEDDDGLTLLPPGVEPCVNCDD